jgi:hypothetical protein
MHLTVSKILNHIEPRVTTVYDRHCYDRKKRESLFVVYNGLKMDFTELSVRRNPNCPHCASIEGRGEV